MTDILLSSSVLIAALAVLRRALRGKLSPRVMYALWALAALRLLLPFNLGASPISVQNVRSAPSETVQAAPSDAAALPETGGETLAPAPEPAAVSAPGLFDGLVSAAGRATGLPRTLALVWLSGAVGSAVCLLVSNLVFRRRLRRTRVPFAADCPLPVYVAAGLPSPCLCGFVRPAVYLTPCAAADPAQTRFVLAHELAHERRGDNGWALIRALCLVVWWFDPLVWLAAALSRRDGELACDEAVLKALGPACRFDYGRTLLALSTASGRAALFPGATAMSGSGRALRERIDYLSKAPQTKRPALVLALVLCAALTGCAFTGAVVSSPAPAADEGYHTLLLAVRDEVSSTDTLLLCRCGGGELNACFLPRSLLTAADAPTGFSAFLRKNGAAVSENVDRLSLVYAAGGRDELCKSVGTLAGFRPERCAVVTMDAVEKAADALGGVDFNVPQSVDYDDELQDLHIHLQAGQQHLDGAQLVQLLRRLGCENGDLGRIGMQTALLSESAGQWRAAGKADRLAAAAALALGGADTDLSSEDLTLWLQALSAGTPQFLTAPTAADTLLDGSGTGISCRTLVPAQWLALVNACLNPGKTAVTAADCRLVGETQPGVPAPTAVPVS